MKKVFVALANSKYVDYSKALFASAKLYGKWDGDFVLIIPEEDRDSSDVSILEKRGIKIYYGRTLPGNPTVHFYKIYLFDEYFKKWDWIFYCDVDALIFDRIEFDLIERDKSVLFGNAEPWITFMQHFFGSKLGYKGEVADVWPEDKGEKLDLEMEFIKQNYDDVEALQTCFMLFNKKIINDGYFKKIYDCYLKYHYKYGMTKPGLWDQTLFNIIFYKKWKYLGSKFINWNPVMDQIGWDMEILKNGYYDDNDYTEKIALHFFNFFPPWGKNNLRFYSIWKLLYDGFCNFKKEFEELKGTRSLLIGKDYKYKIKVYNRSCEEDYFESQKLFWWEPFYSNSKYEIVYDYGSPEKCDIVYNNIFNYADQPFEAYEDDNLILCPQPLHKKEKNIKFNIKAVPLLMLEQSTIHQKYDINEFRNKKRTYDFGFVGNHNERYDIEFYGDEIDSNGNFVIDEPGYSRPHYYNSEEYTEINRSVLRTLKLKSYYTRDTDIIWGMDDEDKIKTMKKYLDDVSQCNFVFCPRGTGTSSFRLYETLMMGSIPIITGMKDYPFDDEYDWDSFSLRTDSIKDIEKLISKSENLSDKDIEEMKQNGMKFYDEKCRPDVFNDWVIETYLL
jgi:hypothetical protein